MRVSWVGEVTRIFRKQDWFEIALEGDLSDAPYLADLSKAYTDEDRIAAEAWEVWMRMLQREQARELVVGTYRPTDTYETYTDPIGALCSPDWWSIKEANDLLFANAFGSWVCFSQSDRWALFCYCEGISILGGSADYMSEFRSLLGCFGKLRASFVDVAERQLGPAWVNDDYRKFPGLIRWPPDTPSQRLRQNLRPSSQLNAKAKKSQAASAEKPTKAKAAMREKPRKAKVISAKKPRKAKQSQ